MGARNHHGRRTQFRPADEGDPPPVFPQARQRPPRRNRRAFSRCGRARPLVSITVVDARRVKAGKQDGRFDLGRSDRRAIFDRRGIAGALEHDRTPSAFGLRENLRAHEPERVEDAPHRPLAERSVAVEGRGNSMTTDNSIISRQPVPALPKSSISRGGGSAPIPGPRIRHWPGARRSVTAPKAWQALPVLSTSSPSSSPSTFVSPQARRPSRNARCEIDLSPGGRKRPLSGRARLALSGEATD